MNSQLTYRLYERADVPELLSLWQESTGWGQLTEEQWEQWYVNTPHGPCTIAIGVDETGGVRAQTVYTPTVLAVANEQVKASRMSSPILDKRYRVGLRTRTGHPIARLHGVARDMARQEGFGVLYAFPHISLRRFLERYALTFTMDIVNCVAAPIARLLGQGDTGLVAMPVRRFGEEYATLWEESKREFPIKVAVVRSPAWLQYRFGGKLALEARDSTGRLTGYLVLDEASGLLLDCLARNPEDLSRVVGTCLAWVAAERPELREIKAMRTPLLTPVLEGLGFELHPFQFLFARDVLQTACAFDLNHWHFMPGD